MTAKRNDATERQVQAATPNQSTWLAANAGSGKTRVLTDRVARLLLDGVDPQHILCLTYTKAAASEMQNRLFKRLGEWAMLEPDPLRSTLQELGVDGPLDGARLAQARTLFARAIETPGGLKIQTIHSFCSGLLRRFPMEAGVSPGFKEVEDRAAALLREEIVEDFALGPQAALVTDIARYLSDDSFEKLTAALSSSRQAFEPALDRDSVYDLFGLPPEADQNLPLEVGFDGRESLWMPDAISILRGESKTMVTLAEQLAGIDWNAPTLADLEALYKPFLYAGKSEAKIKSTPTKNAKEALGPLLEPFLTLMERVAQARDCQIALSAAKRSLALHQFAAAFLPEYARRKQLRGWLDFDDLILKARDLLSNPDVAAWVLFRLDGGIDHILVDEAQDTSPAQWDVIEKLAQEFTSGEGARKDVSRTIFVVGDKKQSIYSFQGADPASFDRMQSEFSDRLQGAESTLTSLTLEYSFRSSHAVLALVDQVFDGLEEAGFVQEAKHRAFKGDMPGRVDFWPALEATPKLEETPWTDPVDRKAAQHQNVVLANRIAGFIRETLDQGASIPTGKKGESRPARAGDFLILVQRRSDLFAEIIRACKTAGLPIAGADRLKVGAELAVKDLASLLSFLATPEDSLALAEALKSPLFGWSEQALFDLAHRRETPYLWAALRTHREAYPETMAILDDLRGQTDFLRPYDLLERILTRHRGRQNLLARLGAEAEDGINALLSQALAYESTNTPSLTGFLSWMQTDDLEIKRQIDSASDLVRVMTVHGSKGLEAPIVILPDTAKRRAPSGQTILKTPQGAVWRGAKADMPAVLTAPAETEIARAEAERLRLLYVALTRAEAWLIVAAAGDVGKENESWHQRVAQAMDAVGAVELETPTGAGLRYAHGDWPVAGAQPQQHQESVPRALPDWAQATAKPTEAAATTLSPSDLGGAKALPGEVELDRDAAMARGTQLHLLLEHLPAMPQDQWPDIAANLLPELETMAHQSLLDEAAGVLNAPDLAHLFAPQTLCEVPISANSPAGRIHGTIDRLIVTPTRIIAVDFKSNAQVPETAHLCPEGLLRQMGAYAHALAQVYPGRQIETALVWTRNASLMALPHDLVTEAFHRVSAS